MSDESSASEVLLGIFPEWSSDQLMCALAAHGHDLLKTVESLLRYYDEAEKQLDPEKVEEARPIVCKYFLQGRCLIKNCKFLHSKSDRSSICRYWLQGFCMRGDECAYAHQLDEIKHEPTFTPLKEEKIPSVKPSGGLFAVQGKPESLSTKLKLDALILEFSHVHPVRVEEIFTESGFIADVARSKMNQLFGSKTCGKNIVPVIDGRTTTNNFSTSQYKSFSKKEEVASEMPWLTTGSTVDAIYSDARLEAEEHSRLRNHYFMLATRAYLTGDGKTAKEMSQKGREHDRKASEFHEKAAQKIFQKRNEKLLQLIKGRRLVDVHGLHPDEANQIVRNQLRTLPSGEVLDIITGTGHHSFDGEAKLLPAIKKFLITNGWKVEEIRVGDRGGLLECMFDDRFDQFRCSFQINRIKTFSTMTTMYTHRTSCFFA